jgi:hypothetical protein
MSDNDKKPRRFKRRDEYTIDEELRHQQAENRGEPIPRFERDEYKQARRQALEESGFEPEDEPAEKAVEDMTPEEHYQRIRSGRGL